MTQLTDTSNARLFEKIAAMYGLDCQSIFPAVGGYRNLSCRILPKNGQAANVLLYKNEPDMLAAIRRADAVSGRLAAKGLPVRRSIDPRIVCLRTSKGIRYAALYNYLPGATIPWEAYTKNHIKLTGQSMSAMHAALKEAPRNDPGQAAVAGETLHRMKRYFAGTEARTALRRKLGLSIAPGVLDKLIKSAALGARLPGQHMLHMDFVRGNLLFQNIKKTSKKTKPLTLGSVEMTGIIDFEKTACGHPVFDVARTLAFLLVDCERYPTEKIYKYFLVSGYNKRGPNRFEAPVAVGHGRRRNLLEDYVDFFLLHDFYKFLRHNPYEFLEQNHHFVRTRDILLRRNMVEYSE